MAFSTGENRSGGHGVLRSDVADWRNFYSDAAFRDIGNETAAFRSDYLNQLWWEWTLP